MRIYWLGYAAFATPAFIVFLLNWIDWWEIKERWNKDSTEERSAAKKTKWALIRFLGMFVWFLTVPILIVYGLIRLFRELSKSENNNENKEQNEQDFEGSSDDPRGTGSFGAGWLHR